MNNTSVRVDDEEGNGEIYVDGEPTGIKVVPTGYDEDGVPTGYGPATEADAEALSELSGTEINVGDTIGPVVPTDSGEEWAVPEDVTDRLPDDWEAKPNRSGTGTRWQDPDNPGNGVRIDQGNPDNTQPSQQEDHVVVRHNGRVIGRDGNPIDGSIAENYDQAHIPLSEYETWSTWNRP